MTARGGIYGDHYGDGTVVPLYTHPAPRMTLTDEFLDDLEKKAGAVHYAAKWYTADELRQRRAMELEDAAYIAAFHPEVAKELIAEVRRLREALGRQISDMTMALADADTVVGLLPTEAERIAFKVRADVVRARLADLVAITKDTSHD